MLSCDEIELDYNGIKSEKVVVSEMKVIPIVIYENLSINGGVVIENQKIKFNCYNFLIFSLKSSKKYFYKH